MNSLPTIENEEARPEVDGLLRSFFQAEMPKPWPHLTLPHQTHRTGSFWSRSAGRLALAACVALLVAGYVALSGNFPSLRISNGVEPAALMIGKGDTTPKADLPMPKPFVPVNK